MADHPYTHLSLGTLTKEALESLAPIGWWLGTQDFRIDRGIYLCSDGDGLQRRTQVFIGLFRLQTMVC